MMLGKRPAGTLTMLAVTTLASLSEFFGLSASCFSCATPIATYLHFAKSSTSSSSWLIDHKCDPDREVFNAGLNTRVLQARRNNDVSNSPFGAALHLMGLTARPSQ